MKKPSSQRGKSVRATRRPSKTTKRPQTKRPSKTTKRPQTKRPSKTTKRPQTKRPSKTTKRPQTMRPSKTTKRPQTKRPSKTTKRPQIKPPKTTRRPQIIRPPKTTRRPQIIRPPKTTRRPQIIRPPKTTRRSQIIRPPKTTRRPQIIRPPKTTRRSQIIRPTGTLGIPDTSNRFILPSSTQKPGTALQTGSRNTFTGTYVGVGVGVGFLLVVIAVIGLYYWRRKPRWADSLRRFGKKIVNRSASPVHVENVGQLDSKIKDTDAGQENSLYVEITESDMGLSQTCEGNSSQHSVAIENARFSDEHVYTQLGGNQETNDNVPCKGDTVSHLNDRDETKATRSVLNENTKSSVEDFTADSNFSYPEDLDVKSYQDNLDNNSPGPGHSAETYNGGSNNQMTKPWPEEEGDNGDEISDDTYFVLEQLEEPTL